MQWDYHRREINDVLSAGPHEDEDWFRVQAQGKKSTKWLSITADQLEVLAEVMDETNPPTLLHMQNRFRVIRADTWFNADGAGEGYVLAERRDTDHPEWATWHVYLHKGERRWLAMNGCYDFRTLENAVANYNKRRGVSEGNGPAVYFVAWVGGYDQPSHFATFNEDEARARFTEWKAQAKNDEGDADWVTLMKFNPATGTLTEVDAQ